MSDKDGISGLLALNNIDEYTRLAIDSMLNQSRPLDELVIVINGKKKALIKSALVEWYSDFTNIKFIDCGLEQLSFALNLGLTHCEYKYVARMDADDISHPKRIEMQLKYMEAQSLDMVGCAINKINSSGEVIGTVRYPRGDRIRKILRRSNPFCHPAVMFKKETLIAARGYNAGFKSEDYDLWLRLSRTDVRWDNIDDILFSYRIHNSTAQRKSLAYAELTGLMFREMLINKSFPFFIASLIAIMKFFIRGKD